MTTDKLCSINAKNLYSTVFHVRPHFFKLKLYTFVALEQISMKQDLDLLCSYKANLNTLSLFSLTSLKIWWPAILSKKIM